MTPHIQLSSGAFFNFLDPDPSVVTLDVVAEALSKLCRFTGHTHTFYSVAQHSVLVSYLVPEYAKWGLLHDAAEAFLGDVSSPLKQLVPDYKAIERRIERVVWGAFGLEGDLPPEVKIADLCALKGEREALLPRSDDNVWGRLDEIPDCPYYVIPHDIRTAKGMFIARARKLGITR